MALITDPARELYEVTKLLDIESDERGAAFLAGRFEVDVWSTDFLRILTCISERIDLVITLLEESSFDLDLRDESKDDLQRLRSGFVDAALTNKWNVGGRSFVTTYGQRVRVLQPEIRRLYRYPRLEDQEATELVERIAVLLAKLEVDENLPDRAVRAARAGLEAFIFQLTKLRWCNAEYTLEALRRLTQFYNDICASYDNSDEIDPGAWLHLLGEIVAYAHEKLKDIKNTTEPIAYLGGGYNLIAPTFGLPLLALPSP